MPKGGRRTGAGRKPKSAEAHQRDGTASRAQIVPHPSASGAMVVQISPPLDLSDAELSAWQGLAPLATAKRTLTMETAFRFRELCENIVLKRAIHLCIVERGLEVMKVTIDGSGQEHVEHKANSLLNQYRGMQQLVNSGLKDFSLSPFGKPDVEEATPVNALQRFLK